MELISIKNCYGV